MKSGDVKESSSETKEDPQEQHTSNVVLDSSKEAGEKISGDSTERKPLTQKNLNNAGHVLKMFGTDPESGDSLFMRNLKSAAETPLGQENRSLNYDISAPKSGHSYRDGKGYLITIPGNLSYDEQRFRGGLDALFNPNSYLNRPENMGSPYIEDMRRGVMDYNIDAASKFNDARVNSAQKRFEEFFEKHKGGISFWGGVKTKSLAEAAIKAGDILLKQGKANTPENARDALRELLEDPHTSPKQKNAVKRILQLHGDVNTSLEDLRRGGPNLENLPFFIAQNTASPITRGNKTSAMA